jgi:hypothetical protein
MMPIRKVNQFQRLHFVQAPTRSLGKIVERLGRFLMGKGELHNDEFEEYQLGQKSLV